MSILVIKKEPTDLKTGTGNPQRIDFVDDFALSKELEENLGPNYCKIRHPTLKNVLLLYSRKPGLTNNFRLGYNGDYIKGTVYFISNTHISLTEKLCDEIIHSLHCYIIKKEYIK